MTDANKKNGGRLAAVFFACAIINNRQSPVNSRGSTASPSPTFRPRPTPASTFRQRPRYVRIRVRARVRALVLTGITCFDYRLAGPHRRPPPLTTGHRLLTTEYWPGRGWNLVGGIEYYRLIQQARDSRTSRIVLKGAPNGLLRFYRELLGFPRSALRGPLDPGLSGPHHPLPLLHPL